MGKKEDWDGARTLYELLEIEDHLKPYITNHKLNIFDYHECEDYSYFHTENRFLFELLSCSENKEKTAEIIKKYMKTVLTNQ